MKLNAKQAQANTQRATELKQAAKQAKQNEINRLTVSAVESGIDKASKQELNFIVVDANYKWSQAVINEIREAGFEVVRILPPKSNPSLCSYLVSW